MYFFHIEVPLAASKTNDGHRVKKDPMPYLCIHTQISLCICTSGSKVIKLFSCSGQLSMKFSPLINTKNASYVGIFSIDMLRKFYTQLN